MSLARSLLPLGLHAALMLAAAPLLVGLIRHLRARLAGFAAPPVQQPWRDLRRLLRKQPVLADDASPITEAAPILAFAATAGAALLVPSFTLGMAASSMADLIAIAGLLALARAALALAALDSGTAASGIGARRTITLAAFAEPALLLVILVLALAAGSSNIDRIAMALRSGAGVPLAPLLPAAVALALVGLAGTAILSPNADSALALEFSGRDLALVDAARMLRLLLWFDLLGAAFVPFGMALPDGGPLAWLIGAAAWLARTLLLSAGLAAWQALRTGPRPGRVPGLLGMATVFALLAALALFATSGAA